MCHPLRIAVVLVGLGLVGQAVAQDCNGNGVDDALDIVASFQGLGDLPGGEFESGAYAISPDGMVVVGSGATATGYGPFRWTSGEGMIGLGNLPGFTDCRAWGVSAGGSAVAGECENEGYSIAQAFRWTASTGVEALEHLPDRNDSRVFGISADGQVIVGHDCTFGGILICDPFRWTPVDGPVSLGHLPGGYGGSATGVSADGSIVVGYNAVSNCIAPFRWTADDGILPLFEGCAIPNRISPDGSVVIGTAFSLTSSSPFRWTAASGVVLLDALPGGFNDIPLDLSADGAVIVGGSLSASRWEAAFLWDAVNGTRSLQAILADDYGVDPNGWELSIADGISAEGRTIVGWGINPDGFDEAWIATLPSSSDCNANGVPDECDQDCNDNGAPDACETWLTVPVDIRPGACPNVLNRAGRGELSVGLLGTEGFDVNDVNVATVRLNRAGCASEGAAPDMGPHGVSVALRDAGTPDDGATCSCRGQGGDGEADLIIKFRTDDLVAQLQLDEDSSGAPLELVVTGELNDGTPFIGSDCVQLVPPVPAFSESRMLHLGPDNRHHE